jgi:ketosteroid isomerase-like protein
MLSLARCAVSPIWIVLLGLTKAFAMQKSYTLDYTRESSRFWIVGRAAIQQYFKGGFDQVTTKATLTSEQFTFMGTDWAYDRGTYAITTTPKAGGNPTTQQYRYLTLLHREPDGWKMKRDTYNSGKP